MKRTAKAQWRGNIKQGKGTLETQSGTLSKVPYSFSMRFENEPGTNPEELIGAAHAGCFAMAMAGELEKLSLKPDVIDVQASVTIENLEINKIHLDVSASVPGANAGQVEEAAKTAKENCPVSKVLSSAEITMKFQFISQPGETIQTGPH